ncbi:MAG: patatin-like phospholipase family protein [Acidimicrobiia bacterium]|nr:patatin-like phospholipase family protein [Acidimicrobiia bacterium]
MTRVGLVLGAGGLVGQAYHAGVLAALETDLGWDARTADVIVGTSAGSVTGTALRMGLSATDLAAWATDVEPSPEGSPLIEAFSSEPPDFPPFDLAGLFTGWRFPAVALLRRMARKPWAMRPSVVASTLLPAGSWDVSSHAATWNDLLGDDWPDGLLICAARRIDGRRVVFGGPRAPDAPLSQAVAASCAIPGYFAPVRIGRREYLDGGVHSSTNADVLRSEGIDVAVVVAPMSAAHGRSRTPDAAVRWTVHRRLEHEVRRLRNAGVHVVRFEPRAPTLRAMGLNAMSDDRGPAVVRSAYFEAAARIAEPRIRRRLEALAHRRRAA